MIKKILLVLVALIAIVCIAAAFRPDSYTVERTAVVAAPPPVVLVNLTDFRQWPRFNPWHDLDTTITYTYEGSLKGEGAVVNWSGKGDGGKGRMTITKALPDHVQVDMEFIEPFAGKAVTDFGLQPVEAGTELTWRMTAQHNFLSKIMCMFMDMDAMMGEQFAKGFAKMNTAFQPAPMAAGPLVFTRDIAASRDAVWNAWTKPEEHMKWWGPRYFTCPAAHMDVRNGGTFHVAMRGPDGRTVWNKGTYTDVVPKERIVYAVQFADSLGNIIPAARLGLPGQWPEAVNTSITLAEVDGRTRLTLVEEGVPAEMRGMSEQGMNECLDKLAETLK